MVSQWSPARFFAASKNPGGNRRSKEDVAERKFDRQIGGIRLRRTKRGAQLPGIPNNALQAALTAACEQMGFRNRAWSGTAGAIQAALTKFGSNPPPAEIRSLVFVSVRA